MTNRTDEVVILVRMNPTPIYRPSLILLALLFSQVTVRAEEPTLRDLLRDALYTEEVTRDSEKAAKQYEDLLARHDAQKTFAASALFRLAEVRRKQDRKDDAIQLSPPKRLTLEQAIAYIDEDELVEVTPNFIRLRKIHLDPNERKKASRAKRD